jgi:hypothetical protein
MIPADLEDPWSPFILTVWNFKDLDVYRHDETLRNLFVKRGWAPCERQMVHFENGNFDLFDKEAGPSETSEPLIAVSLSRPWACILRADLTASLGTRRAVTAGLRSVSRWLGQYLQRC